MVTTINENIIYIFMIYTFSLEWKISSGLPLNRNFTYHLAENSTLRKMYPLQ